MVRGPQPKTASPVARLLQVGLISGGLCGGPVFSGARAEETPEQPFRVARAADWPAALSLDLQHRSRFEHLRNQFRQGVMADGSALALQTLIAARAAFDPLVLALELEDARVYAEDGLPLDTGFVDTFDILQATVGLRGADLVRPGDRAAITVGRMTLDLGSRRLVQRNGFRNTISAFSGIDVSFISPGEHGLRAFAVVPVDRLPDAAEALSDNEAELDRENTDALLSGVFYGSPAVARDIRLEGYVIGFVERDGAEAPSRNRRLLTPGFRVLRKPAPGRLDFELESMLQLGRSRGSSAATDTADLDHRAWSSHASLGFTWAVAWSPRLVVKYDHASGDADPTDGRQGRFDVLFGSRRFELGPVGLYGAVARANLSSPEVRAQVAPAGWFDGDAYLAYRLVWLAEARDAWTAAGLRDPAGASGRFVGQQIEARVRWNVLPGNLLLEAGGAHFVRGRFAREAPGGRSEPITLVYTQLVLRL